MNWQDIPHTIIEVPNHHTLLEIGKRAQTLYIVVKGAVRMSFLQDGKDVTLQFFFENQPVCSFESFLQNTPSQFAIETIEPCQLMAINKEDLFAYANQHPESKEEVYQYLIQRMIRYTHLFLSRIKDTPEQRYRELIEQQPELLQRIPQYYIASYLGITPVSLSGIRARK